MNQFKNSYLTHILTVELERIETNLWRSVPIAHASLYAEVQRSLDEPLWTEMFKHVFLTGPPGNTALQILTVEH